MKDTITEKQVETNKENNSTNFTDGMLVLVGTIAVIVLLKFLSNFAQKQKSTNE